MVKYPMATCGSQPESFNAHNGDMKQHFKSGANCSICIYTIKLPSDKAIFPCGQHKFCSDGTKQDWQLMGESILEWLHVFHATKYCNMLCIVTKLITIVLIS